MTHQISSEETLRMDKSFNQEIRLTAEEAKKQLSITEDFTSEIAKYKLSINRSQFESLIKPFIDRTIQSCIAALIDAEVTVEEIDEIIMVGGSTRVPYVQQSIQAFFSKPLHNELNPDEVVALGAAVQADVLAGNNKDILLLDITPLSLGIETMGGLMDVLIPRNSKIPTKAGRQYTTQKDGQSGIRISVYQGERDLVRDNRMLAEFNLSGIPNMPAGMPKVDISFLINADGILVVTAKELRSGVQQTIEVQPQYGISDEQVEKMLMDSLTHAKEDMQTRALVEAQTEAHVLLASTQSFLEKNTLFLSEDEILETKKKINHLQQVIESGNKNAIQKGIEELNEVSRPYAERIMDEAISRTMKGKKI
jgi:molecular chaperone HscA